MKKTRFPWYHLVSLVSVGDSHHEYSMLLTYIWTSPNSPPPNDDVVHNCMKEYEELSKNMRQKSVVSHIMVDPEEQTRRDTLFSQQHR